MFDVGDNLLAYDAVGNLARFGNLLGFPALIAWIEFGQDEDELVENAHRKRAGATGRIEDFHVIDGFDKDIHLGGREPVLLVVVGKEAPEAFIQQRR